MIQSVLVSDASRVQTGESVGIKGRGRGIWGFVGGLGGKESVPGSGRSPGEGNGNPLQYSCLENPVDRGAWWAVVHGVAESWTRLERLALSLFRGIQLIISVVVKVIIVVCCCC